MVFLVISTDVTPENRENTCKFPESESHFADAGKRFMPPITIATSLVEKDWVGVIISQILIHGLYATNSALEKKIGKQRPCGCSGALPSGHMIMYASSASFLQYRYGWKHAFPAYVMMFAFTYDRVQAHAHSWGDVLTTAIAVNAVAYLFTPKFIRNMGWPWSPKSSSKLKRASKPTFTVVPVLEYGSNTTRLGLELEF